MTAKLTDSQEIVARLAITDVLHRYARGIDRIDMAAVRACWHPGGTDNRPPLYQGPVEGFLEWLEPTLRSFDSATHVISNILINRRGDAAGVESYWTANLRITRAGRTYDVVRGGRYLDRFECRDGAWAILHRHALTDYHRTHLLDPAADAALLPVLIPAGAPKHPPVLPARNRSDLSYAILDLT